jgi:hypothetical protein
LSGINERPIQKIAKAKMSGGMAQVAEYLPSKHRPLSSKPKYHEKKK